MQYCIDSGGTDGRCIIYQCHETTAWQQFFHLTKDAHVEHHRVKSCLNMPSIEIKEDDQWNYNPVSITNVTFHYIHYVMSLF